MSVMLGYAIGLSLGWWVDGSHKEWGVDLLAVASLVGIARFGARPSSAMRLGNLVIMCIMEAGNYAAMKGSERDNCN